MSNGDTFWMPFVKEGQSQLETAIAVAGEWGFSLPNPPVQSLTWVHDGGEFAVIVGQAVHQKFEGETAALILEDRQRNLYLVFTKNRGLYVGSPILGGRQSVRDSVRSAPLPEEA